MFWGACFLLFAAPAGANVTAKEKAAYLKAMASDVAAIKKQVDVLKSYVEAGKWRHWHDSETSYLDEF